jgi:AAA domain, putative AbiEii toxin, Type IV TA system
MPIRSFEFKNHDTGWALPEAAFDKLNLLVGISGVGKTQILRSLLDVRNAALLGARYINNCDWMLSLEADGTLYEWRAETALTRYVYPSSMLPNSGDKVSTDAHFVREEIRRKGEVIVKRDRQGFVFGGDKLPKLEHSESAIKLLQSEELVRPLYQQLYRWLFVDLPSGGVPPSFNIEAAESLRTSLKSLEELKNSDLPIVVKAYVLQQDCPSAFDEIKEDYFDTFPNVVDLRVGRYREFGYKPFLDDRFRDNLTFGIREVGVDGWIADSDISAGMAKVLVYFVELSLTPPGSVVFIDELENSLGKNCLPEVADLILERASEIQFIVTSHHPEVINRLPYKCWKVIRRRGSVVDVIPADSIVALHTASSLEKFTQLINLREYEEGVG